MMQIYLLYAYLLAAVLAFFGDIFSSSSNQSNRGKGAQQAGKGATTNASKEGQQQAKGVSGQSAGKGAPKANSQRKRRQEKDDDELLREYEAQAAKAPLAKAQKAKELTVKNIFTVAQRRFFNDLLLKIEQLPDAGKTGKEYSLIDRARLKKILEEIELLSKDQINYSFEGITLLSFAVQGNHLEIVHKLLACGADPNVRTKHGTTMLFFAAIECNLNIVETLLAYKVIIDEKDSSGFTPLYAACQEGNLKIVELLLKNKANPNIIMKDGLTSLYIASQEGKTEIVELLLKNKANPNVPINDGTTPLIVAIKNDHTQVAKLLLEYNANVNLYVHQYKVTALHVAVQTDNLEIVEILLKKEVNIDFQSADGATAFILAVENNNLTIIEKLLACGANPNLLMIDGIGALHFAAGNGNLELVMQLLQKNPTMIDIKAKITDITPLYSAVIENRLNVVIFLLENGANPNIQMYEGSLTLLCCAVKKEYEQVVQALLKNGANPNLQAVNNRTSPLIYAVNKNNLKIIKILFRYGANINIPAKYGITPLGCAVLKKSLDIVRFLIQSGADCDIRDERNFTPLMLAIYLHSIGESMKDIIDLLEECTDYSVEDEKLVQMRVDLFNSRLEKKVAPASDSTEAAGNQTEDRQQGRPKTSPAQEEQHNFVQQHLLERSNIDNEQEIESQELIRRERLNALQLKRFFNLQQKLAKEQEALTKQPKGKDRLPLAKKSYEQILQEKGGLSEYEQKQAKFYFEQLLEEKRVNNLDFSNDKNYFVAKNIFGFNWLDFDWRHIINLKINWKYNPENESYVPYFQGGHSKQVIEKLIQTGLVEKIDETKWANGCIEYVLKNTLTQEQFHKTVFPEIWGIENIYRAIINGAEKSRKNPEYSVNEIIEIILQFENIYIKLAITKDPFGYRLVTAYPIKSIEGEQHSYKPSRVEAVPSASKRGDIYIPSPGAAQAAYGGPGTI